MSTLLMQLSAADHLAQQLTRYCYRVYLAGAQGPVLLCLHGGGYTGMTWAVCAQRLACNG